MRQHAERIYGALEDPSLVSFNYQHSAKSPVYCSPLPSPTFDAAANVIREYYDLGPDVPVQLKREMPNAITPITGDELFQQYHQYLNQGAVFKVEFDGMSLYCQGHITILQNSIHILCSKGKSEEKARYRCAQHFLGYCLQPYWQAYALPREKIKRFCISVLDLYIDEPSATDLETFLTQILRSYLYLHDTPCAALANFTAPNNVAAVRT
ncbi:hypothetical protein HK097_003211, partial [Rhizophlyctis rosea]